MKKLQDKRISILVVALMATLCLLTACGRPDDIDISGYADREIVISGVTEQDIHITIEDLKNMDADTITTESTSDKIGKVQATGVWLDTVLAEYDAKQADFAKAQIIGADEYDAKLLQDYLSEHPLMLCYGIDGEPLSEDEAPCRIIIKNSNSAYWVRQVNQLIFTQ